jgi:hypothetical protein
VQNKVFQVCPKVLSPEQKYQPRASDRTTLSTAFIIIKAEKFKYGAFSNEKGNTYFCEQLIIIRNRFDEHGLTNFLIRGFARRSGMTE